MPKRTYIEGKKLTFKAALAVYEKIVKRPATQDERRRMAVAWIRKPPGPRQK
jgi:hypothetical protein